ncbi:Pectinesterase 3 [Morus notabilis]|uniref:Pectinesterase 3 n=1 Tax=Morus notabilis TaxID=981085 RepID=W9SL87_9ROSA|nr:Pectinesterase 3 [Morus notabilis]
MEVRKEERLLSSSKIDDMQTWLSTTITDQETCLDALDELNSTITPQLRTKMQNSTEFVSNSLAIVAKIIRVLAKLNVPIHRTLLGQSEDGFPEWLSAGDRRLLQDDQQNDDTLRATVAQDGTGDIKKIQEGVDAVPKKSKTRFVIRIKQGTYLENVVLDKNKWNVMMIGDGKTKTIVSGGLNFIDGTPTFHTATFGTILIPFAQIILTFSMIFYLV